MWPADQYQLLDFGHGRKLERFGSRVLDRPSPAAESADKASAALWSEVDLRLQEPPFHSALEAWTVSYGPINLRLRITPYGHVGLFPEHEQHWQWLQSLQPIGAQPPQLLNLFAYTGGASLVMAQAGWRVVHVDSSAPTVAWARENAVLSNLTSAPIRWLIEDARLFARREAKRGRRYEAILLDPPSYGHGPKGQSWDIDRDLPELLETCCQLLVPGGALMLTGHSAELPVQADDLAECLQRCGHTLDSLESGRTQSTDVTGRKLDFGWFWRIKLV